MSTITQDIDAQPEADRDTGAPDAWPPLAHLVWPQDRPVKKGTIALCGAKLMGIDLSGATEAQVCEKCCAIFKRSFGL